MYSPKISIIVPVYNVERYLRQCIDSILAQTYKDFELLLIDDGSPDNSGNICDEYAKKDPRIRVFHKPNGGVSTARNMGIDNARGEWIAFVDSDDAVKTNYLSTFIEIEQKHGGDFIVTNAESVMPDGRAYPSHLDDNTFEGDKCYKGVIYLRNKGMLGVPWNKLYSASIIRDKNVRFDKDIWSYEDEIFVVQYLRYVTKIVTSAVVTYSYMHREGVEGASGKYIPIDMHFRVADILYKEGLVISEEKEYLDHLDEAYARHLAESIYRLYWLNNHFKRNERIEIIKKILVRSRERRLDTYMFKALKKGGNIYFHGVNAIDFNGLCERAKKYTKRFIKSIMPDRMVFYIKDIRDEKGR